MRKSKKNLFINLIEYFYPPKYSKVFVNINNKSKIPWSKPWINQSDIQKVKEAVGSGWISGGPNIELFEKKLSNLFQSQNFLACSNGTAALHLALLSLGLAAGDEVIVPGYGFMAAANVSKLMGLKIKFADIRPEDFSIDLNSVESLISSKTRVIIAIHTYGFVGNCKELLEICKRNKLYLIEDCAEALFSGNDNYHAGEFGDISTFSFHATKTITTGEGGAISSKNKDILNKIGLLRSHGMLREVPYQHEIAGLNYRMTNFQAALGISQLDRKEAIRKRIEDAHKRYEDNFSPLYDEYFYKIPHKKFFFPWSYPLVLLGGYDKVSALRSILELNKIETRPGFVCPNNFSYLQVENKIENCEHLSKAIINLPLYSTLTYKEIDFISKLVIKYFHGEKIE